MLSKQELANPAMRIAYNNRGDVEAPRGTSRTTAAVATAATTPDRGSSQNLQLSQHSHNTATSSTFVWLENVSGGDSAASSGRVMSPVSRRASDDGGGSSTNHSRTTSSIARSRRPSYDDVEDDADFYSVADDEASRLFPGAVRVPGLNSTNNSTNQQNDDMTFAPPEPTILGGDSYHHVVAQAVDEEDSENEDLRQRVTNLEQDLRRSYMLLSAAAQNQATAAVPSLPSVNEASGVASSSGASAGSEEESAYLRRRLLELEQQLLASQSNQPAASSQPAAAAALPPQQASHPLSPTRTRSVLEYPSSPNSSEMGFSSGGAVAAAPRATSEDHGVLTAQSAQVVMATTVADGVVDPTASLQPPPRRSSASSQHQPRKRQRKRKRKQFVEETASSDEDKTKKGLKCCLLLLLLAALGVGAYFIVTNFILNDDDASNTQFEGVGDPSTAPTIKPTSTMTIAPTVYCPPVNDNWFLEDGPFVGTGSQNRDYLVDCGVIRDVSALEIDAVTCEPRCAFLLQRFAYDDRCSDDDTFAFAVRDEKYENATLVLGYLGGNAPFSCSGAEKYILPEPTIAPSAAPIVTASNVPTGSPTCPDVGLYFDDDDVSYTPSPGGRDSLFTLACGGSTDIGVLVRDDESCEVECVGRLQRDTYQGVCQLEPVVQFSLNGDFRNTQVLVGYLQEQDDLDCDSELQLETPGPTPGPVVPTSPPTPLPTSSSPPPTPAPTLQPTRRPVSDFGRFDELVNLLFSGDTPSESSPSYRAVSWLSLEDPRGLPIEDSWDLAERYALAVLYFATNGESWNDDSRWLSGDSQCDWRGVRCDSENRIVELSLSNNRLRGSLVDDLGDLRRLEVLELQGNSLEGNVPTEFGRLTRLTALDISENDLGGYFPTHIGRMTSLRSLQIRNNGFVGELPRVLSELRELQRFDCEYNQFVGSIPRQLGSLTNMAHIYLGHNELVGTIPSTFGNLRKLELLSLSANELTGPLPEELAQLTLLERFSCSQNEISSTIPSEFESWTQLTYLSVWGNRLTGTIPNELRRWTRLENIYIDGNRITGGIDVFCRSDDILEFYADCGNDGCECCTFCCNDSDCVAV